MNEANESVRREENIAMKAPIFAKKDKIAAARDYNSRRKAYRRQVSLLRKQYAIEIAKQKAEEEAKREAEMKLARRRLLERRRQKNIRSAQSAVREHEKRLALENEFKEYLRVKQEERDERKSRFIKARQMVIDELEAEAHLWLTTPAEVEAAFTHEAEQFLWVRPTGVLGARSPSLDSHFWQYETHTMHLDKTYKTARALLLEGLLERIYEQATVDEKIWTPERVKDCEELERKGKLRTMVRAEGRRTLLQQQKEILEGYFSTTEEEVPRQMPAPNVKVLANVEAQESEGVDILLRDPTKFFRFENENESAPIMSQTGEDSSSYFGPSLGVPAGLRDPLRDGTPWSGVFPIGIAKVPKADTRTQREKKRQEREQKMWEAAMADKVDEGAEIDMAASNDVFSVDNPIDYDSNDWDSDDEEWEKGLDPVEEADIIDTPSEYRFAEDDIRWVISQLELRSEYLQSQITREMDSTRQRLRTQRRVEAETAEESTLNDLLLSLTDKQMIALVEVDSQDLHAMSSNELSEALSKVSGLEEGQVKRILGLDTVRSGSEHLGGGGP